MTCHRGILAARRHAVLCDEIEQTAPAVEGGYLDRAVWRSKLPISVRVELYPMAPNRFIFTQKMVAAEVVTWAPESEATRAYLALCESLTAEPTTSLPVSAEPAAEPTSSVALSSRSAATPADTAPFIPGAVLPGADSPSAPGTSFSVVS